MHHAAAPQSRSRPRRASTRRAGKRSRRRSSDLLAALASNPLGCLKASGGRRNARTGTSPVVPPSTVPHCAPSLRKSLARPGQKYARTRPVPLAGSPLEEAHAPSTRPWPVKCTGQPTQPSNRRPNAPPVAVPHGSLASSTLTGALRSTRRASSKRGAPLVILYAKGGRSGPARANPNPQRTNQRERPLP